MITQGRTQKSSTSSCRASWRASTYS